MTIGDLVVRVGAQIDGYKSAMAEVPGIASQATGKVTSSVTAMSSSVTASLTAVASKLSTVGPALTVALTLPLVGLGAASLKASADMDSMRKGLDTITHNAAETEKQLASLREVAKIPGLDFQGAVKGSINLQAAGFSAQLAERALKAFGNALASVGKGREDLEGVNLVLTQILNKPKVMAQDLNQLRERLPQVSQLMKAAFGSSVSEDIQKLGITGEQFVTQLIAEFEKLPPAATGLKNTFENVRDSAFQALAKLGDNLAPLAMRTIDVVINPLINAVSKAAGAFSSLPGPVQNAALGLAAFLVVAGPAATIVGKLVTTVTTLAGIYTTVSGIMAARVIPALVGTQAAVSAVQVGTVALGGTVIATGSTFTTLGSTIGTTMATATTATMSLHAALGLITIVLGAIYAGYVAWKNIQNDIKPLDTNRREGALGENFVFTGFGGVPVAPPKSSAAKNPAGWNYITDADRSRLGANNARDFVTSLPAPRAATTGGGMDAEALKKAFSDLGIKDLEGQLAEAEAAFQKLMAAGKLTEAWQVDQATKHITDLRAQIAELAAGWKAMPKSSEELLKTLGVDFAPKDVTQLQQMGAALAEFAQKVQNFVGPQQDGLMNNKLAEAWQTYAHAVATADDEFKKHIDDVPWLKFASAVDEVDLSFQNRFSHTSLYVKTEADLNQEMRNHLQTLRELPQAHRPVVDVIMDAFGAVNGLADAYHYFNLKTPMELASQVAESERQYKILKDSGTASAAAITRAFAEKTLKVIELERQEGTLSQELYEQRKKMAEDAIKSVDGEVKGTTTSIRKYVWSASDEMARAMQSAFDSTYRALARSIVDWKDWGKNLKNVALDTFENMLSIALKAFLKPLEDQAVKLAGKIGGVLGGIWGGGSSAASTAGSAASTAAGAGSSGAGAAASAAGSFANVFNMVTGAVSAISGVFSAIGTFRLEGTMNAVEHNTRYMQIQFQKFAEQDEWDRETHLMLKLDDMWNEIRNVVAAVRGPMGGAGSGVLETIRDYAVLQVRKIDEFIVPKMDTMIDLLGKGGGSGGGPVTNQFYFYGADIDEIAAKLKAAGVYV